MPSISCSKCNFLVDDQASFCANCGTNLKSNFDTGQEVLEIKEKNIIESKSWLNIKTVIWLYGLILLTSFVLSIISSIDNHPRYDVGFWGILLILITYFAYENRRDLLPYLKFSVPDTKSCINVLTVTLIGSMIIVGYFKLLGILNIPMIQITENILKFKWPIWTVFLLGAILPGILEEIAFRGVITNHLEKVVGKREALVIQAAGFSILHLMPAIFISHFCMGIILGWMRIKTKNIYWGMLFHILWNSYAIHMELI